MEGTSQLKLHKHYHGCWWPGDAGAKASTPNVLTWISQPPASRPKCLNLEFKCLNLEFKSHKLTDYAHDTGMRYLYKSCPLAFFVERIMNDLWNIACLFEHIPVIPPFPPGNCMSVTNESKYRVCFWRESYTDSSSVLYLLATLSFHTLRYVRQQLQCTMLCRMHIMITLSIVMGLCFTQIKTSLTCIELSNKNAADPFRNIIGAMVRRALFRYAVTLI